MTEQVMAYLDQGLGIVLEIAILAGLFFLRKLRGNVEGFFDSRTNAQKRQLLAQLGKEAFAYAETVYRGGDGPAKLNEAVRYMIDRCEDCGLGEVPMKEMRAVIEGAWLDDRRKAGLGVATVSTYRAEQR
ncbi:phage holin, LLH family [Tumebacillus sp. DT12]|uniref:Phage holin, LLH family n=1 Tax=Tumebacillus lacus TaxID=2995335 RepID=A0ABT3X500_9BACL|nr:phage holin, LLH family [Tumebacillus lacus]MCX7570696.1 phage holin, LLH family [Tumebacillus lacus]